MTKGVVIIKLMATKANYKRLQLQENYHDEIIVEQEHWTPPAKTLKSLNTS